MVMRGHVSRVNLGKPRQASTRVSLNQDSLITATRLPTTTMADAAAQYKKQDGRVAVSADGQTVSFKSTSGALPPLSIAIADIGSMSLPYTIDPMDG
jgi:hypothetical protein